jgi:chemotaxis protein CheX
MLLNGVRTGTGAPSARPETGNEKEQRMAVSLRESLQQVSDPRNLDESVKEVFQLMLGLECRLESRAEEREPDSVTAVVGFGGLLSGACVFSSRPTVALEIAAQMTGMEFTEIDDTVKDAIGEICNMLAGAWKGKVPELAAHCGLSVPAVITGRDYRLHVQAPEFQLHHAYAFADSRFHVTIVCDGLQ